MDLTNKLYTNLKRYFHYDSFKLGQKEIIKDVLQNKDVLGVLPTGSGKSLCYQLPALMNSGITIVITPLISLMIDQVRELRRRKIRNVVAINSFTPWRERQAIYANLARYKIIYVSPELIQQESLLKALKRVEINLFVIDEAHCISQWGHEFRTDYLRLKNVLKQVNDPPVLALTATATKQVQNDILNILQRPKAVRHVYSVDRSNLIYSVQAVERDSEKLESLVNILGKYRLPTLIYFTSRKKSEVIADEIKQRLPHLRTSFYHGGMEDFDRLTVQQQFMNDQIDVICCTSAFGMGINKNNIRLIIHYHFPLDLESYSQEIGRAGRDGLLSLGIVLYNNDDLSLQNYIINQRFPDQKTINDLKHFLLKHKGENYSPLEETLNNVVNNNEVHLQFLHYHFEKHDIIDNNRIIKDEEKISSFIEDLSFHVNRRQDLKREKLLKMINWLQRKECLRAGLNEYFHSKYEMPEQCCSSCGFTINDWKPKESKRIHTKELDWRSRLSKILITEAENELK